MSNTCREDGECLFTRLSRPSRLVGFGHARQTGGDAVLVLLQKFPRGLGLKQCLLAGSDSVLAVCVVFRSMWLSCYWFC